MKTPALAILFILLSSSIASADIMSPKWTDGDRFVYVGFDSIAIKSMSQILANGTAPESIERLGNDRLITEYKGDDECTRTAWDGPCGKSIQTYQIDLIANWSEGSTLLESDLLFVSIFLDREVWEPVERIGSIAPFTDIRTSTRFVANFTVGSEENSVEVELIEWLNKTRSGDWPERVKTGDSWVVEEEINWEYSQRSRENGGPWSEPNGNSSSGLTNWFWSVGEEVDIYVGEGSQTKVSTTLITIEENGGEQIDRLWLHDEGYILQQETRINGEITALLQVFEWTYQFEDARNVQVTGNDRTGTIFLFALVGIVLVTIMGWIGYRAYNIVKEADYIDNIAEKVVNIDRNIREKGRDSVDSNSDQPRGLLTRDTEIINDIDKL